MARHKLTEKDPLARTAVCSVCGPVEIRPVAGGKSWICLNKKRESGAAWRAAHPEYMAASRHRVSAHKLTAKDPENRRGDCPVCGVDVQIVPFGLGWACAIRNAEMGRSVQEVVPRCLVCNWAGSIDNPLKDGRCGYHFVGWEYAEKAHKEDGQTESEEVFTWVVGDDWEEGDGTGYSWVNGRKYEKNAARVTAKESVVPGWKMAGQDVPRDEWAKWNQLLASEGL